MDSLYDQLLKLQQIPHAYEHWKAYRAALTEFIVQHTCKGTSVIVIGAGECNDFDLYRMAQHFSKVTLLGRNDTAMYAGLGKQDPMLRNVYVVKADLLGISDASYRTMDDVLLQEIHKQLRSKRMDARAFEQLFLAQMQTALQCRKPDPLIQRGATADYVICCGVHSQLLSMFPQMAGIYHRYMDFDISGIYRAIKATNTVITRELNIRLMQMAKFGIFLGLEKCRAGIDGGIEGASQALRDIEQSNVPIACETTLLWPFDQSQKKTCIIRVFMIER